MKMPLRSRLFTLCADDFGQSEKINAAVIELVRVQRLGATSAMSQGPAWAQGAREIRDYLKVVDVGLHLNLTHRFSSETLARPLEWWLLAAPRGWIKRQAVRDTFLRQVELFERYLGRLPDYVDGHQHVHAFPLIREILTEVIAECWRGQPQPWVRAPDCLLDSGGVPFKAWVLKRATRGFAAHISAAGLNYTRQFAGLYALTSAAPFEKLMHRWLHQLPSGTLLMVHPGHQAFDHSDPIAAARFNEYQYLTTRALSDDCQSADASLVRFGELAA